nr:MAG TPA: hypothetical protein [Caudoviricetes sp.]
MSLLNRYAVIGTSSMESMDFEYVEDSYSMESDENNGFFARMWESIKNFFKWIKEKIIQFGKWIGSLFETKEEKLMKDIKSVFEGVKNSNKDFRDKLDKNVKEFLNRSKVDDVKFSGIDDNLPSEIKEIDKAVVGSLKALLHTNPDLVKKLKDARDDVIKEASSNFNKMAVAAQCAEDLKKTNSIIAYNWIMSRLLNSTDGCSKFMDNILNLLTEMVEKVIALHYNNGKVYEDVDGRFSELLDSFQFKHYTLRISPFVSFTAALTVVAKKEYDTGKKYDKVRERYPFGIIWDITNFRINETADAEDVNSKEPSKWDLEKASKIVGEARKRSSVNRRKIEIAIDKMMNSLKKLENASSKEYRLREKDSETGKEDPYTKKYYMEFNKFVINIRNILTDVSNFATKVDKGQLDALDHLERMAKFQSIAFMSKEEFEEKMKSKESLKI